jgi:hypothetical protein
MENSPLSHFKTKTGYCHIFPDRIQLTRENVAGEIAEATYGNSMPRTIIIFGILLAVFIYFGIDSYNANQIIPPVIFGIISLYLAITIARSYNNSATPVIPRDKIKSVTFKKAITGFTRAYFVIMFENEKGKIKKRLIMLPGSLTYGKQEAEKALALFKREGLLK